MLSLHAVESEYRSKKKTSDSSLQLKVTSGMYVYTYISRKLMSLLFYNMAPHVGMVL